jgi:hypothetical protein
MALTPEMFSHVALGLTNLPNAIFTSLAILYLLAWFRSNEKTYFYLSMVLMSGSMWSRSDSIAFLPALSILLFLYFVKNKEWKLPLIYISTQVGLFIIWNLFIKLNVGANSSDFFIKHPFWDYEKLGHILDSAFGLMLGDGVLYGLSFYLFIIILGANLTSVLKERNKLIIFILVSWVVYTWLYYQIDYSFAGNIDAYLNASYKRGLFNFIPLVWFFVADNALMRKIYTWVDNWIAN